MNRILAVLLLVSGNLFAQTGSQQVPIQMVPAQTIQFGTVQEVPVTTAPLSTPQQQPPTMTVTGGKPVTDGSLVMEIRLGKVAAPPASGPVCGGVINGRPQQRCGVGKAPDYAKATLMGKSTGYCPGGTFLDAGTNACWTCPPGFHRTAYHVAEDRACAIADPSVRGEFGPATFRGGRCPPGSFFDSIRKGECWSCPNGYARTVAHVEANWACHRPRGPEQLYGATWHNKGMAWDCRPGTFWDGEGGGNCWSCPGGWRTAHHIRSGQACARAQDEHYTFATLVGLGNCGPGEILDGRNGGECWTCPPQWARTVFPIHENRACEKVGGERFAKATQQRPTNCPEGQFYDIINGGTCWTCPKDYGRTSAPVTQNDACIKSTGGMIMEWYTAPYKSPGLFGLGGGEAVALDTVKQRQLIEDATAAIAPKLGKSLLQARSEIWAEIGQKPHESAVLSAAVLGRMMAVLQGREPMNPAMNQLISSFAEFMREYRVYLAQDALNAYDQWDVAHKYWKAQDSKGQRANMAMMFDLGTKPPDFQEIVNSASWAGIASGGGMATLGVLAMASESVQKVVFPFAGRALAQAGAKAGAEVGAAVTEAVTQSASKAGSALGKAIGGAFSKFSGPLMIVTIAAEVLALAIEHVVEIADARPKLVAALADARRPVDLRRLAATDQGVQQIMAQWSVAMSGATPASQNALPQLFALSKSALDTTTAAAPAVQAPVKPVPAAQARWVKLPGAGNDIAIGANGTMWALGTAAADANGYEIFRMIGANWTKVQGAGTRLAVDPQGNAWVLNRKGEIYKWTGSAWTRVQGPFATDIGIGRNGRVWIIGMQPEGSIHRLDGNAWVRVQGAGVSIAVDANGNPAVVNSQGAIWYYNGQSWAQMSGAAVDIAIGAAGHVWVLGTNQVSGGNGLWQWNGTTWVAGSGGLTGLAVAPDGKPLGVNVGKEFWRMQ